jgi:hypothetical protein
MMLYEPRDVGVVFQYKYGLAQTGMPFTSGHWISPGRGDGVKPLCVAWRRTKGAARNR